MDSTRKKPALLIMAAGMGSRYGGLKQIDPIGPSGEIILDYSVYDAIEGGFGKVVFVIRRDIEAAFREAVGSHFEGRIPVEYAFQALEDLPGGYKVPEGRSKPWGTGQAILAAKSVISEPFAVINADDFYGRSSFKILGEQLSATDVNSNDYAMAAFTMANTLSEHGGVTRGVCQSSEHNRLITVRECEHLRRVGEKVTGHDIESDKDLAFSGKELVSMNCWGFTPTLFEHLEEGFLKWLKDNGGAMKSEYLIPSVVDRLIADNIVKVDVLETPEKWYGITYPEDKPVIVSAIAEMVRSDMYSSPLWH